MFSYCENNPVNRNDPSGECANLILGAVVGAIVSGAMTAISSYIAGEKIDWGEVCIDAAFGAVNGVLIATGASAFTSSFCDLTNNYAKQCYRVITKKQDSVSLSEVAISVGTNFLFGKQGDKVAREGLKSLKSSVEYATQKSNKFLMKAANQGVNNPSTFYSRRAQKFASEAKKLNNYYTAAYSAISSFVSGLNIFD